MDPRERITDPQEGILSAMDGRQAELWTAMPGIIDSFDPTVGTVACHLALKMRVRDPKEGTVEEVEVKQLTDCPVVFPSGGGFCLTFPLQEGDECLIVFANRCIDAWWDLGDVQSQLRLRMHDLSDGFVIPGPWSKPKVPASISGADVQLRSDDGTVHVGITTGKVVEIMAPNGMTIHGNVTITGDVTASGTITGTTQVVGGGVHMTTHTHKSVSAGTAHSGTPDAGT